MTHQRRRRQAFDKATDVLLAIQARARSIRKSLSAVNQGHANHEAWGRLHEAMDLAAVIKAVASKAVGSSACDAETTVELLELFEVELQSMVSSIATVRS